MSGQHESPHDSQNNLKTDFGAFYPSGYIVVAFDQRSDTAKVRDELLTGGYAKHDCELYSPEEVAEGAKENYRNSGLLASVGTSAETVRQHWNAAEEGAYFLLLYAPNELDCERAMNVVRRVPFRFAHRYRRFVIEQLN